MRLQVVENIFQLLAGLLMKTLTNKEGKLVGVLAWSRNSDCSWPVVVEMGEFVSQLLDVVGLEAGGVSDHVVGGRVDGPLPHGLGDQEEVVSLGERDDVINNGATGRVAGDLAVHLHHPRVDLLVHDNVRELDLVLWQSGLGHAGENGGDLVIDHVLDLTITNAISERK